MLFTPAQIKPKSFESRRNSSLFLPGVDAPHVYVRAWALGCFHSLISTQTFQRSLTASVDMQLHGDKEYPFSGVRLVSGRTSVRYRFGSPFSSKRWWFVDTVL